MFFFVGKSQYEKLPVKHGRPESNVNPEIRMSKLNIKQCIYLEKVKLYEFGSQFINLKYKTAYMIIVIN